jgi:hypothetical protein
LRIVSCSLISRRHGVMWRSERNNYRNRIWGIPARAPLILSRLEGANDVSILEYLHSSSTASTRSDLVFGPLLEFLIIIRISNARLRFTSQAGQASLKNKVQVRSMEDSNSGTNTKRISTAPVGLIVTHHRGVLRCYRKNIGHHPDGSLVSRD